MGFRVRISSVVASASTQAYFRWLGSGPLALFNALVILAVIGIVAELFGESMGLGMKIAIIVIVVFVSLFVFFLQQFQPALSARNEYQEALVKAVLERLVERYRHENHGDYDLRVNVMKLRRTHWGYPLYLKIDYSLAGYSELEQELEFKIDTGCCGWAFVAREQTIYDKALHQEALRGMTQSQREATDVVHCVLSTPIFRGQGKSEPIGILNLDSQNEIGETMFRDKEMKVLVAQYAAIIGSFLR